MSALDVVELDDATLAEAGAAVGKSKERTRVIQETALRTLRKRLHNVGITAEDAASTGRSAGPAVGTFLRSRQCADCLAELPDAHRARCSSCEAYEIARQDGHDQASYAKDVYQRGVLKILSRWRGTTT